MTTTARTQYIDNVKKGIEIYAAMNALKDNESIWIKNGKNVYQIHCSKYDGRTERMFSIGDGKIFGRSMNIDNEKNNKTSLYCYTYDLFSNKSSQRLYFQDIELTTEPEETK